MLWVKSIWQLLLLFISSTFSKGVDFCMISVSISTDFEVFINFYRDQFMIFLVIFLTFFFIKSQVESKERENEEQQPNGKKPSDKKNSQQ